MEREAGSSDSDLVTLDIEGTKIHCIRKDLSENSDYFQAMFERDFVEKNQSVITIKGVKPEAMKIIHKLLYDTEFTISENDIFSVLQATCMLQFLEIRRICLKQVETYMRPDNCMSIWILAEHLVLKEICYKAKLLSLLEFSFIKNSEEQYFLELDLDLILSYLGNVNLQCTNEFHVYEMLSTWYENCEAKNEDTLRKLLHCVNYTSLTGEEMDIIINSQCVTQFKAIADCLKCVKALKNGDDLCSFKDEYVELANKLLSAKDRNLSGLPCILIDNAHENIIPRSAVLYLDLTSQTWKKLFATGVREKLYGFKVIGYKNFVLIFGGELRMERGVWNYDFYIYDVIKETWTKKRSPHARRHFESCVCGDKVFIVGGIGPQGADEKNMFWYDFVTGEFSSLESLPQSIKQIKCCQFQDELFVLNLNREEGYIFNSQRREWTTLEIVNLREIPLFIRQATVFSYRKCIYVRFYVPANRLYEMKMNDGKLVTNVIELPQIRVSFINAAVFIADTLYTLSSSGVLFDSKISLNLLNINTREHSKCFQQKYLETFNLNGEKFWFTLLDLAIFSLFHPDLVVKNDLINVW